KHQLSTASLQALCRFKHLCGVSVHLDLAPLLPEFPFLIDQERAAFYAEKLAPVKCLLADHVELPAQRLVRIREQVERQFQLFLELFVGRKAVARYSQYNSAGALELCMQVPKILPLGRATGRAGLRVEIQDHLVATQCLQLDCFPARGGTGEIRNYSIQGWSTHPIPLVPKRDIYGRFEPASSLWIRILPAREWSRG